MECIVGPKVGTRTLFTLRASEQLLEYTYTANSQTFELLNNNDMHIIAMCVRP